MTLDKRLERERVCVKGRLDKCGGQWQEKLKQLKQGAARHRLDEGPGGTRNEEGGKGSQGPSLGLHLPSFAGDGVLEIF